MKTTVLGITDTLPFGKYKELRIGYILNNCYRGAEYLYWWDANISHYPLSQSVKDSVLVAIGSKYGLFEDDGDDDLEKEFTF